MTKDISADPRWLNDKDEGVTKDDAYWARIEQANFPFFAERGITPEDAYKGNPEAAKRYAAYLAELEEKKKAAG